MDTLSLFQGIMRRVQPTTRREFLKRVGVVTVAVPAFGSLLAACGGDDDDDDDDAAPPAAVTPTAGQIPTPGAAGAATATTAASPTAAGETPTAQAVEPTATTAAADEPKQGGTIRTQGHHEISSLHPDEAGPYVHYVIVRNIHEPLIDIDINFAFKPILAESFEVAPDGLQYTFKLREGVPFHDGEEFTSADVKYNLDWYRDTEANPSVLGSLYVNVADVAADDDYNVTMTMSTVDAAFLPNLVLMQIVPEHIHAETGKDNYSTQATGTGPFKIKEWKAAEYTTVEKFADYWDGAPNVDEFREDIVPEGSVRAVRLETGEADNSVWPLQAQDTLRFLNELQDDFDVYRAPGTAVNHFPLRNDRPALADKVVRQAMMMAADRDSMINDLEQGLSTKAHSNYTPAIQFYFNDGVRKWDYDPDAANAMLDEAGYVLGGDGVREKDGVRLAFTCTVITGDQRRKPEAELLQQNLRQIGVEMQIQEAPVATILEQLPQAGGNMDASLFNWTYGDVDPDARTTLRSDAARNWSQYKNPEMDTLLDAGVATIDPDERQKIYYDIQAIVAEDVPFLYIQFWEDILIWNKRVKGRPEEVDNPGAVFPLVYKMWIDDEG
jgi:peptide/nickel transport system substrate-binding protein